MTRIRVDRVVRVKAVADRGPRPEGGGRPPRRESGEGGGGHEGGGESQG